MIFLMYHGIELIWQNYTILGDLGLISVDTENPSKDDVSTRFLPIQWAIDSVS
jgi:hypothetical protein